VGMRLDGMLQVPGCCVAVSVLYSVVGVACLGINLLFPYLCHWPTSRGRAALPGGFRFKAKSRVINWAWF